VAAYVAVFGVAAAVTFLLGFPVRRLARRVGAVAYPDPERVHRRPTPLLGGVAMLGGVLVALAVARLGPFAHGLGASSEVLGVALGAIVIAAVGLADDVRDMSAPAKVAGQVMAAIALYAFGVTMYQFRIPRVGFVVLSPEFLPLVGAIWVVGIANAVNLIDGLDGLAAGIVAIGSGALCIYALRLIHLGLLPPDPLGPVVAAVTCGVCVGFLPHNFHPARMFMGDMGAMLLGLLMAAATMVVGGRAPDYSGETYFFFAPLAIPFFILGVPLLDTVLAIVRRTARRTGVTVRDLEHLHHRLMRLGHGHRRAVLILWAWTAVLSAFVLYPTFDPRGNVVVPFGGAFLVVGLYTVFRPGRHRRLGTAETAGEGDAPSAPSSVASPAGGVGETTGPAVASGFARGGDDLRA
jgi:UDP-GlcNAc:undecaprenyl-phosphate GlcNAc-1-phosphate transferase